MRKVYVCLFFVFLSSAVRAQLSLTNGAPSATIDFSNTTQTSVGSNPASAFTGGGFEPNTVTAGRLNSNAWATTGFSDGALAFAGTFTSGDHARGSTAVSVTTGGIYAFTGAPASVANPTLMIQPGASDFTPGTLTLRVQNNGTTNITQLSVSYNLYINNDQGWGGSFNFSHSTDDVTYTPVAALDYSSPAVADALGWVIVGSAPSRSTSITGLNIAPGAYFYIRWSGDDVVGGSGSRDEFGLDDISLTATYAAANTITTGLVSAPPFVLANCGVTATGTVAFTTTDVFAGGNIFTAQLSDDIGSFSTPVNIGSLALSGPAPSGTINITIPAGTVSGSGYLIRVVSDNPAVTGTSSSAFTITQNGLCGSSHTDYYQSRISGDWDDPNTWESSVDNITWITATLAPTFNANTIQILNSHTVTIAADASADQLTILSGGTLNHSSGSVFSLNNGSGIDLTINSGGTYVLNGTQPSSTGTIEILNGGVIRVEGNNAPGDADDFAFGNANVTFRTGSVYEWATNTFTPSWAGRTYFTVGENTTYRFSQQPNFSVGGTNPTVIYGVVEANALLNIAGSGSKTIVNGILGSANIDASGSTGNIIINGSAAVLGGSGILITPPSPGVLQIANNSLVTMTSSKTVTGDISLLLGNITLGNFNLTVSGNVTGGSTASHIITNGTGMLTLQNVGATPREYAIGNVLYNPVFLSHSGAATDISARVETGINPATGIFSTYGVNCTWNLQAASPTGSVVGAFQYESSQLNAGLTTADNLEALIYSGSAWSIIAANLPQVGAGPYVTTTPAIISVPTTSLPVILGKTGGWILPLDCIISCRSRKVNNSGIISWDINSCSEVNSFEVQRSVNGGAYQTIGTITPGTSLEYSYTDASLAKGTNLYRIKVNRSSGAVKYSNTVAVINDTKGILITALSPNPVADKATLVINAAKPGAVNFAIYDMTGRPVRQWSATIAEGSNTVTVNAATLPGGIYHLAAMTGDSKTVIRFVKQ